MKEQTTEFLCRFIGCREPVTAPPETRPAGATGCCPTHRRILGWLMARPLRERQQLDELRRLLETGYFVMDSNGWISQVPPKAPKFTPILMDDGSPRYRDWDPTITGGTDGE